MEHNVERVVDSTVQKAESMKIQTAEAFEDAARKLREARVSVKGDEVKAIIADVEAKTHQLKMDVEKKVEPVEDFITEHPFASIAIAVGVGFIFGSLMRRD
ncbi:hypothetical protein CUJ83_07040 [Methanocella sp. CWC-04]|uniref:DUF883 domain-containing protein n=1 Tax=Methanooceanicella nereidis TaxID=2052831 RepID=A0AAP2RC40_9EURY|nr:hypothetical protein [Methanocella sp. CWC-04]MCD1294753.1 hypothetical protein [Methanocella sp. CWC-04]